MSAHAFLVALTIVLGVAAVTTVIFQRLRQPVVLGYILAGFLIGPNVSLPLFADRQIVQMLAELGVILLMFALGLEFSLSKLAKLGPSATFLAVLQSGLMIWLGFVTGRMFGWTTLESLFAGAIIAISSTTIIAKTFDEQKIRGPLRDLVVGVLIVEDLIAVLLMTGLTAMASGAGLSAKEVAATTGKLALFLAVLVGVGLLLVPRSVRAINRLNRPETSVVASIGFCFAVSLLAHELGYSVALGAFLAGSLIAESGEAKPIEHLVQPVRDVFAAIFFVSVGILIDPKVLEQHWPAVAVLTAVVIVGKIIGVFLGGFLTGNGVRTSVKAGLSLAQIGEFSFIIAALGLKLNATGQFLYPIAIAVSVVTTLSTPWLIRWSGPAADFVDRKLPRPIQRLVSRYNRWLDSRTKPATDLAENPATLAPTLAVQALLPGLGEPPSPVALTPPSSAIGQSLAQLNLRGLTGATVLAIQRGSDSLVVPRATDVLQAGDVLALAGSRDAISAAKRLLMPPRPTPTA